MLLELASPWFLLLLLLIPLLIWWKFRFRKAENESYFNYSDINLLKSLKGTWRVVLYRSLFFIRLLILFLIIIALVGPASGKAYRDVVTHGVDIVLTLDISSSMASLDFQPKNRLDMAKEVVKKFISSRESDRLGLVVFSGDAFTQCPLTLDHDLLLSLFERVRIGMIEDGTAVGNALALSVQRLKDSPAKSKIIILLTDGVNNRGEIAPLDAARLASDNKIKVYTIGAGKEGTALIPVKDPIFGTRYIEDKVEIDEETLQQIANITSGQYFRAHDSDALYSIYEKINKMERTESKPRFYVDWEPLFYPPLLAALVLFLMAVFIEFFVVKKIP